MDAKTYTIEDLPSNFTETTTTKCNGLPTEDWQRRPKIAAIRNYCKKHEKQKDYAEYITANEDQYMTTEQLLPD